jgi:glycosyltransferase involved in cell wall biosynthesis
MLPPNDMIKVKKPIIGYIGAIRDWLDTELIELIATRRKDWNIVLIGNVGDGNNAGIERLRKLSNVHFLGEKIYHDLPKFIYHLDVCLIPFRKTPLIDATNPVKFYEYLASGKPVVSTTMNDLLPYNRLCYLAENHEDFLKKIEIALNEKDPQLAKDRVDFAKENTWKNRMDVLYPYIESLNKFGTLSSLAEPNNPRF